MTLFDLFFTSRLLLRVSQQGDTSLEPFPEGARGLRGELILNLSHPRLTQLNLKLAGSQAPVKGIDLRLGILQLERMGQIGPGQGC